MASQKILIPDIGTDAAVDVIEILVSPGDSIAVNDSLLTLEGDKATMEVPSPVSGVVESITVNVGDKVKKNDAFAMITVADTGASADVNVDHAPAPAVEDPVSEKKDIASTPTELTIAIPDIGNAKNVDVIEVLMKVGDEVAINDSLLTLETDKASMEVPSPFAGTITQVLVKVGDKVSQGDHVAMIMAMNTPTAAVVATGAGASAAASANAPVVAPSPASPAPAAPTNVSPFAKNRSGPVHAGPAVRRLANELGVTLSEVNGSGRKGRIVKTDIHAYVKAMLSGAAQGGQSGLRVEPMPPIDFSVFGETETKPLSKLKRLTGVYTHRSWVTIPHVTNFDEADITELEAFRQSQKEQAEQEGVKLTPLVFIMKAVVSALQAFPQFNASLDPNGEQLIYKKYFNLGIAVDTPNGLLVPVIRDVDQKGCMQLARELAEISKKAREKGLQPQEMQGSCFTISSLGGVGGTAFTPIINQPDVAILGVSKSKIQPQYQEGEWVPRLMLPLSLSYDHRVIDGVEAARFNVHVVTCLQDIRRFLL